MLCKKLLTQPCSYVMVLRQVGAVSFFHIRNWHIYPVSFNPRFPVEYSDTLLANRLQLLCDARKHRMQQCDELPHYPSSHLEHFFVHQRFINNARRSEERRVG